MKKLLLFHLIYFFLIFDTSISHFNVRNNKIPIRVVYEGENFQKFQVP